jgi:outer membrane receptor protein involved in Fe transport
MHKQCFGMIVVLCFVALLPAAAFGQAVYGSIYGTVTDTSGAVVAGAKVTITSVEKATKEEATTNEAGNYVVTHLIPGTYDVRAEAAGFKGYEAKGIQVLADTSVRVDAQLALGAVTETVTVTAESVPLLKTDRADVSYTLTGKTIEELPLISRNFTEFQLVTPGTQSLTWQHAASENPQQSLQINVNGQHFSGTSFQLDGTDNRDPILGIIVINPNLYAIREAKITTQNYDAEFGQASAAVITVQTKSGTNEFHGSAFDFRQNNGWRARDSFAQSKPDPVTGKLIPDGLRNLFGGSLGGPIVKNKLFFFGDYQGTRQKLGNSALLTVPTARFRSTCLNASSSICDLSEYLSAGQIYDPATGNPNGTGRSAFSGNIIPNSRISPQARALLSLLPAPTASGIISNFSGGGTGGYNQDAFDVRMDYAHSQNLSIMGRYSFSDYELTGRGIFDTSSVFVGGRGLGFNGFAGKSLTRNQSLSPGFNYSLGPTWLTDFRFGWFKYRVNVNPNGLGTTPAKDVGIPGLNTGDTFTSGMPAFFIGDQGQTGGDIAFGYALSDRLTRCNCPLVQNEDQFQFVNNWTNIRGNHQLKFGGDIRYARNLRVPSDAHRAGELSFSRDGTGLSGTGGGVALATFLLGNVTSLARYVSTATDAGERQKRWFFYGQDTWRLSPKLTFNYGLRWEIYFPQTVTAAQKGGFVDTQRGEILVAGVGNVQTNFNVANTLTNLAPRVGIAYEVTKKAVLRLGYGRSYDIGVFGSVFGHSVTQNLPVLARQNLSGPVTGSSFEAAFTLATGPAAFVFPAVPSSGRIPLVKDANQFVQPDKMRMGLVDAWNVTFQYQLTPSMSVEAAYVGNKGTHVFAGNGPDYNLNQPTGNGLINPVTGVRTSTNSRRPFFAGPIAGVGGPFGVFADLRYHANDSSNHYNAIQAKLEKRFSKGYQFAAHYTFSRNTNFSDNGYTFERPVTFGVADFNRTHVFVFANLWELPFGHGKRYLSNVSKAVDYIVGGWQINTITNISTGLPFDFGYKNCSSDIDTATGPCRPDLVGDITYGDRKGWFPVSPVTGLGPNPALQPNPLLPNFNPCPAGPGATGGIWRRPGCARFGSVERNKGRGPHFWNTDFSVFKNIDVTERYRAELRLEVQNVFNHVNLAPPGVFFSAFGFGGSSCVDCDPKDDGVIKALGGSTRQMQVGLRIQF